MVDTIPGSGKAREAFPIRFACDVPPEEGGPPTHKHTGATYVVTPPKTALSFKLAVETKLAKDDDVGKLVGGLDRWMDKAFGREVASQLRERIYGEPQDAPPPPPADADEATVQHHLHLLAKAADDVDDEDPLDISDVMRVMQFVTERAAGVPPT